VVLPRLDGPDRDECRPTLVRGRLLYAKPVYAQWRHEHRGLRQILGTSESPELVERGLAVADHSGGSGKHRSHSLAMLIGLAYAAELRMRDRDEIVHEVDWPDTGI